MQAVERAPVSLSILRKEDATQIPNFTTCVPNWRGHGGRHPTPSSVEFDRQLDKISLWIEEWNHQQRCQLIEALLRRSNHQQFQFLYTVMQPHQHRDFMYTAQKQFPETEFTPVSTHTTREIKRRIQLHREDNYYRVKSAYLHLDDEVKEQNRVKKTIKFPEIVIQKNNTEISVGTKSIASLPKLCTVPKRRSNKSIRKYKLLQTSREELYNSNPIDRFLDMPVRRHIQNERVTHSVPVFRDSRNDQSAMSSMKTASSMKTVSSMKTSQPTALPEEKKSDGDKIGDLSTNATTVVHWYTDLWTDLKRNEFLHKMILKLDPRQHYFISSFMLVRQHRDFISLLPEKIVLQILHILDPKELCKCSEVSKSWYSLANHNKLWKWKCQTVKIKVCIPQNPVWKHVYRDNVILERNWTAGNYKTVDLKGHTAPIEAVIFDRHIIVSGSQDKTVKIWDIKSGKFTHSFEGHQGGVWCLSFFTPNLILSGSHDGTIKVWNVKEKKLARSIQAHEGPVWAMSLYCKTLVTVSQDKTAKIWDISRCLLLQTLMGHNKPIFAVDMSEDGTLVITGSADRTVKIWELETGNLRKTIWVSSTTSVMAVSYSKGFIAAGYDNVVCLHRETGKLVKSFNEHEKRVESVQLKIDDPEQITGSIISAGQGGLVKYWDTKQSQSLQTFKVSKDGGTVKSIRYDDLRIVGGLKDRIRILDFQAQNTS